MYGGIEWKNRKFLPRDVATAIRACLISCFVMTSMLYGLAFLQGGEEPQAEPYLEHEMMLENNDFSVLCCFAPYFSAPVVMAVPCLASDDMSEELLARAIEYSVPHAPYVVRVAYGAVLLNRVKSSDFGGTLSSVLLSVGISANELDEEISERTLHAARDAMLGADPSLGALYSISTDDERYSEYESKVTAVYGKYAFLR